MTDQNAEVTVTAQDELISLKKQADIMGLKYHPSIGLGKLRLKVKNTLSDEPVVEVEEQAGVAIKLVEEAPVKETHLQMVKRLRKEATRLIRVRVTCMNPGKKDWGGEIFTASNSVIGTIKKYVPFDNDEGWHIPVIIYNMIKERKCQLFRKVKDSKGSNITSTKLISEFAVEKMDNLTSKQLEDLAQRQTISGSVRN